MPATTKPTPPLNLTNMSCDFVQRTASATFQLPDGGSVSVYLTNIDPTANPKDAVKDTLKKAVNSVPTE